MHVKYEHLCIFLPTILTNTKTGHKDCFVGDSSNMKTTGVNPAGDAGDVSPPICWLVGTSMGMSPPIFGVAM